MNFYYDQHGIVALYSEGKNECERLQEIILEVTEDELSKLKEGYEGRIVENKLGLYKTPRIEEKEKKKVFEGKKKEILEKIQNKTATMEDIGNFISYL